MHKAPKTLRKPLIHCKGSGLVRSSFLSPLGVFQERSMVSHDIEMLFIFQPQQTLSKC